MPDEKRHMGFHTSHTQEEPPKAEPPMEEAVPSREPFVKPNPDPRTPMFLQAIMTDPMTQVHLDDAEITFTGRYGQIAISGSRLRVVYQFPGEPDILLFKGADAQEDPGVVKAVAKGAGADYEHFPEED